MTDLPTVHCETCGQPTVYAGASRLTSLRSAWTAFPSPISAHYLESALGEMGKHRTRRVCPVRRGASSEARVSLPYCPCRSPSGLR
jgi:hypothetical protein